MAAETQSRRPWLTPLALLGGTAMGWIFFLLSLDYLVSFSQPGAQFWGLLSHLTSADVQQALGNMPEVVVAILGVAITVISIILQLSATRYTPRVTEMFFLDRTNLMVIGFFVVSSIHCLWATLLVHNDFVPKIFVGTTLVGGCVPLP